MQTIVQRYKPIRIVLFGSYAREDNNAAYEFFGPRHPERGAAAYIKVLEKIAPLFAHLEEQ